MVVVVVSCWQRSWILTGIRSHLVVIEHVDAHRIVA